MHRSVSVSAFPVLISTKYSAVPRREALQPRALVERFWRRSNRSITASTLPGTWPTRVAGLLGDLHPDTRGFRVIVSSHFSHARRLEQLDRDPPWSASCNGMIRCPVKFFRNRDDTDGGNRRIT